MNNDLISREALKKAFEKVYPLATNEMGGVANKRIYDIIDNAPTVEPEEVYMTAKDFDLYLEGYKQGKKDFSRPQGEWITQEGYDGDEYYECSICKDAFTLMYGTPKDNNYNFCPNCGADMRKGAEE